jgi:uncharacterized heparinase superfamily protein
VRRTAKRAADFAVTTPLIRWSWTGPANDEFQPALTEFRPTDRETVLEMMQGRYLLASKLVETEGRSPFAIESAHDDWLDDLQAFDWLRHFRDARTDEERRFARALTLDWIDRNGGFDRFSWGPTLCARRVTNWLRHYSLLMEGAAFEQQTAIGRSLGTQIQSLRLRGQLAADPVDALMVALALLGVALCDERRESEVATRAQRLHHLLDTQIDEDGLHRTRCAKVQVMLMVELITMRQALRRNFEQHADALGEVLDSMHRALDAISLGTGEPGYFNGTGQMAHDHIVAVQAQSSARARETGTAGGYGRLISGRSIVVADSGQVPSPEYAERMHAGALSFEFSHGRDLVVCNCGPAPAGMENDDQSIAMRCHGYSDRFGVVIERRLTLLAEGKSLVGQDKLLRVRSRVSGACALRFHLGHQTELLQGDDLLKLKFPSGLTWNFLWEGADMRIEDSVRQSALFGFHRTRQIVLETLVGENNEVSWIFTLDEG